MQPSRSVRTQNIRRIAMIIGFTFFMVFVYKASHDVSSPKIAAGVQRTQLANQSTGAVSALVTRAANYDSVASTVQVQLPESKGDSTMASSTSNAGVADTEHQESSKKQSQPDDDTIKLAKHIEISHVGRTDD